jgi:hypothetical protein
MTRRARPGAMAESKFRRARDRESAHRWAPPNAAPMKDRADVARRKHSIAKPSPAAPKSLDFFDFSKESHEIG